MKKRVFSWETKYIWKKKQVSTGSIEFNHFLLFAGLLPIWIGLATRSIRSQNHFGFNKYIVEPKTNSKETNCHKVNFSSQKQTLCGSLAPLDSAFSSPIHSCFAYD
jgi:hypothetical protein